MIRNLMVLLPFVAFLGCAKPANQIIQSQSLPIETSPGIQIQSNTVLWQQHGGSEFANNVVSNRLPSSGSISAGDTQNGFQIYTAPLVFSDSNATQHVYALWAQTGNLKLAKYTLSNGNFTRDSTFGTAGTLPYVSGDEFSSHQIAIHQTDTGLTLFIAHKDGIDKLDAYTGKPLATYTSNSPVYRLTVSSNILYAQSATQMLKFDIDLNQMASFTVDTYHPTKQLPLIVSGDALFFEHDNKVYKTDMASFSDKIEDTQNLTYSYPENQKETHDFFEPNSAKAGNGTVTAMSAIGFKDKPTVIYAITRHFPYLENYYPMATIETALFIHGSPLSETFDNHSKTASYGSYCDHFYDRTDFLPTDYDFAERDDFGYQFVNDFSPTVTDNQSYIEIIPACARSAGELTHTPLAVLSDTLFLPGVFRQSDTAPYDTYSDSLNVSGIQKVSLNGAPTPVFDPSAHKVNDNQNQTVYYVPKTAKRSYDPTGLLFTNRFVVHDSSQNLTFTVANISDYFFSTEDGRGVKFKKDPDTTTEHHISFKEYLENELTFRVELCTEQRESYENFECTGTLINKNTTYKWKDYIDSDTSAIDNYHSKIIIGNNTASDSASFSNPSMTINTLSVGSQVVFLAGNDSKLYLFQ